MQTWDDVVAYERSNPHPHPDHDAILRRDERNRTVIKMAIFGMLPLVLALVLS